MRGPDLVLALFVAVPCVGLPLYLLALGRSGRGRATTLRLVLANAAMLFGLLGLVASVGEIYYRFLTDETDGYAMTLSTQRWFRRHYARNNYGVRDDRDYAWRVEPGKVRVTFLGDSFTAAQGVREISDRFVNRLRDLHPEWEVQLIGEEGQETGDHLRRLGELLRSGYELGTVVYAYCLNDASDLNERWRAAAERTVLHEPNALVANSYFLSNYYYWTLPYRDRALGSYFDYVIECYESPLWEAQSARLTELRDLVRAHGGQLVVVTFPFFERMGAPQFVAAHTRLADLWDRIEVPQLDLLDTYLAHEPDDLIVNAHDTHPNELAHRLAAERIDDFLRPLMSPGHGPRGG